MAVAEREPRVKINSQKLNQIDYGSDFSYSSIEMEIAMHDEEKRLHRPSSGTVEALYPAASRQQIRTTEGYISDRRKAITAHIAEIRELKSLYGQGGIDIVVFEQRRQDLSTKVRELGGKQKFDRDTVLRPQKVSFRNGAEEKAKRKKLQEVATKTVVVFQPELPASQSDTVKQQPYTRNMKKRQRRHEAAQQRKQEREATVAEIKKLKTTYTGGGIAEQDYVSQKKALKKRQRELLTQEGRPLKKENKRKKRWARENSNL